MKPAQKIVAAISFSFLLLITLFLTAPSDSYITYIGKWMVDQSNTNNTSIISHIEFCAYIVLGILTTIFFTFICRNCTFAHIFPACIVCLTLYIPLLFGWSTDFAWDDTENRTKAEKPHLSLHTITAYPNEMNSYLSDHVPFRKAWLRLNGLIKYGVFHSSQNILTIPGKDGWIYIGGNGINAGENPPADYKKTNLFTQDELEDLCKSLQGFKNYMDSQGVEFRLMITLNKSHIYPEHLPDWFQEGNGPTRAEQVIEYLQKHSDIEIVYPKKALLKAKDSYLLYVPTDAHWNTVGGYIGFIELMKSLNPSFDPPLISDINPIYLRTNWADVANLVNAAWFTDNQWSTTSYKPEIGFEWTHNESGHTVLINHNALDVKMVAYHDSYLNQMMEYLGKEFAYTQCIEKNFNITEEDITSLNPDIVVFEILERMINNYTSELSYWQKYA